MEARQMHKLAHFTPRHVIENLLESPIIDTADRPKTAVVDPIFVNPAFHPEHFKTEKGGPA
jgi:hypothetical protein